MCLFITKSGLTIKHTRNFLSIWHKILYISIKKVFQENWLAIRAKNKKYFGFLVDYLEDKII